MPGTVPTNSDGTPQIVRNPNGSVSITGSTAANVNARVFTQFLGIQSPYLFLQENNSHSTYHSLQASLVHQFSKNLYFQAAYTWSRSIDNASGSETSDELNGLTQFGNLLNTTSNRGLSDFDRTHRLVLSYTYELPFNNLHGFGRLLHGWTMQGATTFQSGTPFTIYDSSALSLSDPTGFDATNYATLVPGTPLSALLTSGGQTAKINSYINSNLLIPGGRCVNDQGVTQSYAVSDARCTSGLAAIGNVGRNSLRGPFQQEWDFSIHKTTKMTERTNLMFGADFFNILNHPSFQSPQAGPNSPYGAFTGGSNGNYGAINLATGSSSILGTVNRPRIIQFVAKVSF
jgi:hypothetical protein